MRVCGVSLASPLLAPEPAEFAHGEASREIYGVWRELSRFAKRLPSEGPPPPKRTHRWRLHTRYIQGFDLLKGRRRTSL
jgi:hypothetical protein